MENVKVELIKIEDIIPYKNNPRKNKKAIGLVKKSIKEFGFKVPLVLDKDNVIVTGHTRYSACKQLGFTEIPCIRATDLTEEQAKAFRLADNKVSEAASWDAIKLDEELAGLEFDSIDMEDFGFEIDAIEDDAIVEQMKQDELSDIHSSMQHKAFENIEIAFYEGVGEYGFPEMYKTETVGDKFIRFCDWKDVINDNPEDYIAHFYYDDYKFITAWREPKKWLDTLKRFKAVVSPDFSLYTDFPKTLQILSCYRRQWCGRFWQDEGIDVIPDVIWGERDTFKWCFDGIPKGGTVAVSTLGVARDKKWNDDLDSLFRDGYNKMLKVLKPKTILFYGSMIEGLEGNIIRIPSYYETKFGEKE